MTNPLMAEILAKEKVQRIENDIAARHQLKKVKSNRTPLWISLMCILKQLTARTSLFGWRKPDLQEIQKGISLATLTQRVKKEGC